MDRGKRRGLLEDYANFQKLSQASDIVKLTGATPVAPDDVEASERTLHMLYETIKHTDKPLIGSCTVTQKAEASLRMVVMLQGRIVEQGVKKEILTPPHHEYTELLLSSVPEMDPDWLDNLLKERRKSLEKV